MSLLIAQQVKASSHSAAMLVFPESRTAVRSPANGCRRNKPAS